MSVSVTYDSRLSVVETFTGPYVSPADPSILIDQLSTNETLTGTTTPPVTKSVAFQLPLVAGAATIDLTALPGKTAEETVNGTGLRVQHIKVRNKATNANPITVSKGASNGYALSAAGTTFSWPLDPGQELMKRTNDSCPDIAAGAKTIDVAGTGTQILEVAITLG